MKAIIPLSRKTESKTYSRPISRRNGEYSCVRVLRHRRQDLWLISLPSGDVANDAMYPAAFFIPRCITIPNTTFLQVYRSSTDVAITAYEPKRCETLRAAVPIRGLKGVSVWIKWEVEAATRKRKRELLRRLGEAQKVCCPFGVLHPIVGNGRFSVPFVTTRKLGRRSVLLKWEKNKNTVNLFVLETNGVCTRVQQRSEDLRAQAFDCHESWLPCRNQPSSVVDRQATVGSLRMLPARRVHYIVYSCNPLSGGKFRGLRVDPQLQQAYSQVCNGGRTAARFVRKYGIDFVPTQREVQTEREAVQVVINKEGSCISNAGRYWRREGSTPHKISRRFRHHSAKRDTLESPPPWPQCLPDRRKNKGDANNSVTCAVCHAPSPNPRF